MKFDFKQKVFLILSILSFLWFLDYSDAYSKTIPNHSFPNKIKFNSFFSMKKGKRPFAFGLALQSKTDVSYPFSATGSITVMATGGTAPYHYSIDTGKTFISGNIFNGLIAGNYEVVALDGTGNFSNFVKVTINPANTPSVSLSGSSTNVTCKGAANGNATVIGSGGNGTYSYVWDTNPVQTSSSISNLGPGTYTATVFQGQAGALWTFVGNSGIEADGSSFLTNGLINLSNPQGNQAAFFDENSPIYQDIYFPSSGTFKIYYKQADSPGDPISTFTLLIDNQQIKNSTTGTGFTIDSTASFTVSAGTHRILFQGQNLGLTTITLLDSVYFKSLTGSPAPLGGNLGFEIPVIGTTGSMAFINNPVANPCFATKSFTITEPAQAVSESISQISTIICYGAKNGIIGIKASGGDGFYLYSGDNGKTFQNSNLFTNLDTGTYNMVVKDGHGCTGPALQARI